MRLDVCGVSGQQSCLSAFLLPPRHSFSPLFLFFGSFPRVSRIASRVSRPTCERAPSAVLLYWCGSKPLRSSSVKQKALRLCSLLSSVPQREGLPSFLFRNFFPFHLSSCRLRRSLYGLLTRRGSIPTSACRCLSSCSHTYVQVHFYMNRKSHADRSSWKSKLPVASPSKTFHCQCLHM